MDAACSGAILGMAEKVTPSMPGSCSAAGMRAARSSTV